MVISLTGLSGTYRGLARSTASRRESAFKAQRFVQMDEFQLAWISCGNFYGNFKCITSCCCSARSTFPFLQRLRERMKESLKPRNNWSRFIMKTSEENENVQSRNETMENCSSQSQRTNNHCQLNSNNKSSINFQPKTILKWNFIRVKWCRSYSRCALCG